MNKLNVGIQTASERSEEKQWKTPHSKRFASHPCPSNLAKLLECGAFRRFRWTTPHSTKLAVH